MIKSMDALRGLSELSPSALVGGRPDGTITFANAAVAPLLGWRAEELVGLDVTVIWPARFHRRYRALLRGILHERPASGAALEGEYVLVRRDGQEIAAHVASRWVDTEDGPISICALTDLSERDRVERVLRSLAERDSLTGLFNRRRFEDELRAEVARAARYGDGAALMVLDLDRFKDVNDTLGHQAGDELLCAVADRLKGRLRESDVLARLGGDEFAVLLPQATRDQAETVAADLLETLREPPFALTGQSLRITASSGVSAVAARNLAPAAVLMEADLAMYDAKTDGRDRVAVFTEAGQATIHARRTWADRIRSAMVEDGFQLYGQPIVDLATGGRERVELLLRLPDPEGGLALPAEFLPVAERFSLMRSLDRWVTRRAIELLGGSPGRALPRLHVNVSSASVSDPDLPRLVEAMTGEHEVDPARLTFEITEALALSELEATRAFAGAVRALGCEVALDDFGRAVAGLHHLKDLPIDLIKIDGDLLAGLADDPSAQLIINAVAGLARGLELRTVAERVVDDATLAILRESRIDYAQGYHLGTPQPVAGLLRSS